GPKSGLPLEALTSAHKLPRGPALAGGPSRLRPRAVATFLAAEGPMLPHPAPAPQPPRRVAVGIDTSRYGPYAACLRDDLHPAPAELPFPKSAAGYALFRQRLEHIAQPHGPVAFVVRLDAAGPYAYNLLHCLHGLTAPAGGPALPGPCTL